MSIMKGRPRSRAWEPQKWFRCGQHVDIDFRFRIRNDLVQDITIKQSINLTFRQSLQWYWKKNVDGDDDRTAGRRFTRIAYNQRWLSLEQKPVPSEKTSIIFMIRAQNYDWKWMNRVGNLDTCAESPSMLAGWLPSKPRCHLPRVKKR